MELRVSNFAKIKDACIIIDGITVIAGENNTGKSTIGKILFSLFNSMSDIERKIKIQRRSTIEEFCKMILRDCMNSSNSVRSTRGSSMLGYRLAERITEMLDREDYNEKRLKEVVNENLKQYLIVKTTEDSDTVKVSEVVDNLINSIVQKTMSIIQLPDKNITLEVLSRYFRIVFDGQINSLVGQSGNTTIDLIIKGNDIKLQFKDNYCIQADTSLSLMHKAIYIDNPFVIDKLDSGIDINTMDTFLRDLIVDGPRGDIMDGIIESVLTKEKLEEIEGKIRNVVDGNIIEKFNNDFYIEKDGFNEPISFKNLSTGLKSFVLIKMLLEQGILKEKDVLILDEPEIHLHPQWQILYAELIVLLQKTFDLSVVVATHSPYFLDAINLFSIKYGVDNHVNYYLSSMIDNRAEMQNVTSNLDLIYKKMVTPVEILDTLRQELNN